MSRTKRSLVNTITNFILQFVVILSGFILTRLVLRNFGSEINGLLASIGQFLGYIILLDAGVGAIARTSFYKYFANKDSNGVSVVLKNTIRFYRNIGKVFIVYVIILIFIYPLMAQTRFDFWFNASLIVIIAMSSFAQYFIGMPYSILLTADQKISIINIIQIGTTIINLIISVILIKLNFSIHIVRLFSSLVFLLRPLILSYYVKKNYDINKNVPLDKDLLKGKGDTLAQHIAWFLHTNTDIVLITLFLPIANVSVYAVYYMIVKGINAIFAGLSNGVVASFGDIYAKGERENFAKNFSIYEFISYTTISIFFTSTALLIFPFIKIYTLNIEDINYLVPLLGYFLISAEAVYCIRIPYLNIAYNAGHFRQTRNGAIVEVLINIILSVILIQIWGLPGVAFATLIAMVVRTMEISYYSSKNILKRNYRIFLKKLFACLLSVSISIIIVSLIPQYNIENYAAWIIRALLVTLICGLVTAITNISLFKKDFLGIIDIIKSFVVKTKNAH